ncbi:MAG: hypothetical protein O7G86_06225 [Gammaproteobacteria bacterium]|nr:hypothetical protein [Gammaproteobacteria bacterium]
MKIVWILGALVLMLAARELLHDDAPENTPASTQATAQSSLQQRIQPRIDRTAVQAKLHRVRTALHYYNVESGEIPTGFNEVIEAGLLQWSDVQDPWGRNFAFRSEKKASSSPFTEEVEIFVYSNGPDGVQDNSDDIYL